MAFLHHDIIASKPVPPTAEGALQALRTAGYVASLVEERPHTFELAVPPNSPRVLIEVSEDLRSERDGETSTRELLEEWVKEGDLDAQELPSIIRLVNVRHLDHADAGAIKTLLDYVCAVAGGRGVPPGAYAGTTE